MLSHFHNFTQFKFSPTCCHTFTILNDSNLHRHAVTLSQFYTIQIHTDMLSHFHNFTHLKFTLTCCHTFTTLHISNSHRNPVTPSQLYKHLKFTPTGRHIVSGLLVKLFRHVILISSSYFNFTHYLNHTVAHTRRHAIH